MCGRVTLNKNPRKLAEHFCLRQAQAERCGIGIIIRRK